MAKLTSEELETLKQMVENKIVSEVGLLDWISKRNSNSTTAEVSTPSNPNRVTVSADTTKVTNVGSLAGLSLPKKTKPRIKTSAVRAAINKAFINANKNKSIRLILAFNKEQLFNKFKDDALVLAAVANKMVNPNKGNTLSIGEAYSESIPASLGINDVTLVPCGLLNAFLNSTKQEFLSRRAEYVNASTQSFKSSARRSSWVAVEPYILKNTVTNTFSVRIPQGKVRSTTHNSKKFATLEEARLDRDLALASPGMNVEKF